MPTKLNENRLNKHFLKETDIFLKATTFIISIKNHNERNIMKLNTY